VCAPNVRERLVPKLLVGERIERRRATETGKVAVGNRGVGEQATHLR